MLAFSVVILTPCRRVPSWRSCLWKLRWLRSGRTDLNQVVAGFCFLQQLFPELESLAITERSLLETGDCTAMGFHIGFKPYSAGVQAPLRRQTPAPLPPYPLTAQPHPHSPLPHLHRHVGVLCNHGRWLFYAAFLLVNPIRPEENRRPSSRRPPQKLLLKRSAIFSCTQLS